MQAYFAKWAGEEKAGPLPPPSPLVLLITSLGGFVAMGAVSAISVLSFGKDDGFLAIVGSYGALMVIMFGAPASPLAQPRNVLGGNLIATLVGVGSRVWIADNMGTIGFALPFAVTLSYFLMSVLGMVNPPAGGTAAICVISSTEITHAGWKLVVTTSLYSLLFILVACLTINLIPGQSYPKYWFISSKYYYPKTPPPAPKVDDDPALTTI
ncbi:hypothetical protein BASA81_003248 [Batrachochytrium salamandrivorans]|nr:hypothetical protein BASA81_003248 [Batrachochytrium salamandrivorans]